MDAWTMPRFKAAGAGLKRLESPTPPSGAGLVGKNLWENPSKSPIDRRFPCQTRKALRS
jgi:hypothetical protein